MSVESRLARVEESLRLLRNADRLQGRRFSAATPGLGAVPRWNTIDKVWDVEGLSDDLTTQWWAYTDFLRGAGDNADPYFSQTTAGTGSDISNIAAEASHVGVWGLTMGTTTTGHARLNTQIDGLIFSNGRIRFGAWIRTTGSLSDATDRYTQYAGIFDNSDPDSAQEGILFRYRDNVNGGKWQARVANGGSFSGADTGITVTTGTWYSLEMEINAAGDSVEFFIDDASVATIASGPAANSTAEARIGALKSAGTNSRTMRIDAAYLTGDLTAAR